MIAHAFAKLIERDRNCQRFSELAPLGPELVSDPVVVEVRLEPFATLVPGSDVALEIDPRIVGAIRNGKTATGADRD